MPTLTLQGPNGQTKSVTVDKMPSPADVDYIASQIWPKGSRSPASAPARNGTVPDPAGTNMPMVPQPRYKGNTGPGVTANPFRPASAPQPSNADRAFSNVAAYMHPDDGFNVGRGHGPDAPTLPPISDQAMSQGGAGLPGTPLHNDYSHHGGIVTRRYAPGFGGSLVVYGDGSVGKYDAHGQRISLTAGAGAAQAAGAARIASAQRAQPGGPSLGAQIAAPVTGSDVASVADDVADYGHQGAAALGRFNKKLQTYNPAINPVGVYRAITTGTAPRPVGPGPDVGQMLVGGLADTPSSASDVVVGTGKGSANIVRGAAAVGPAITRHTAHQIAPGLVRDLTPAEARQAAAAANTYFREGDNQNGQAALTTMGALPFGSTMVAAMKARAAGQPIAPAVLADLANAPQTILNVVGLVGVGHGVFRDIKTGATLRADAAPPVVAHAPVSTSAEPAAPGLQHPTPLPRPNPNAVPATRADMLAEMDRTVTSPAGQRMLAKVKALPEVSPPGPVEPIVPTPEELASAHFNDSATPPARTMRPVQGPPHRGADTHPPTPAEALPNALEASLKARGIEPPPEPTPTPATVSNEAPAPAGASSVGGSQHPIEQEDDFGTYKLYGNAIDPSGNWKRFAAIPDDGQVALYHATSRSNATDILTSGYNAVSSGFTKASPGHVYLGSSRGLGTYEGIQGRGDPVQVVFSARKGDIEPDAGSDWKSYARSNRADIISMGGDPKNPSAVDTYTHINQVRVPKGVAVPVGVVDLKTGQYVPRDQFLAQQGVASESGVSTNPPAALVKNGKISQSAPAGAATTPRETPLENGTPNVPQSPNMVGSTNLDRIQASDSAKARITRAAHDLGLVDKPSLTDEQAIQGARDLGVTIDDLRAIPPGEIPSGVEPKIWQLAVRNLRNHYAEAASDAEAVNRETPSAANQAAQDAANDDHRLAMQHTDEVAQRGGQLLQGHSIVSYNEKSMSAQRALRGAPKLPTDDAPTPPAGRAYGSRNKLVTKDQYQGLKDEVAQWFKESAGRASAGIDPSVLVPLTKMALYHLEAGARAFGPWLAKMKADTGADLSDTDWQSLYANAQGSLTRAVADKQAEAVKPVFVDQLAAGLGSRLRASKFVDAIRDADGTNTILDKLIHGGELTPAQMKAVEDAWNTHVSSRSFKPSYGGMATVRQIARDARVPQAGRRVNARTGAQVIDDSIRARIGKDAGAKVRADLEGDDAGKSALAKLEGGQSLTAAEGRRFAQAVDAYRGVKPKSRPHAIVKQMRTIIADARAGRLGYDSPKDYAKDVLGKHFKDGAGVIDPKKYDAAIADLAKLDDGDYAGIAHAIMRHLADDADNYQHFVRSNILSGVQTLVRIIGAHDLTIGAEEFRRFVRNPASSALGTGAALKAGLAAVPDSFRLLHKGPLALQLAGKDRLHVPGGHDVRTELSSRDPWMHRALAPYRIPMRVHGAIYHVMQTYNFERGLFIEAEKAAKAKGLKGQAFRDEVAQNRLTPTPAMTEAAIRFAREETQTNPNQAASWLTSLDRKGPIGKIIRTNIAPVAEVPLNSMGRQIEMATGSISAPALARLYARMHPDATPAEVAAYRQKVFERGLVGAGIMAYGYYRQQHKQSNPPDPAHGEYGSVNAKGQKWDVGQYGNVGGLENTGAIIGDIKDRVQAHMAPSVGEAAGQLFQPFADNPYTRINENLGGLANVFTGEDPRKGNRAIAGAISMHKPFSAFLSQGAALTDPARGVRSKQSVLDYVKNAQPGYREDLALTNDPYHPGHPYPQPGFFRQVPLSSVHHASRLEQAIDRARGPSTTNYTPAENAAFQEKLALMDMLRARGKQPVSPEIQARIRADIKNSVLTRAQAHYLKDDALQPPVVGKFMGLRPADAVTIFADGTPDEQKLLRRPFAQLLKRKANDLTTAQRLQARRELDAARALK